MTMDPQSLHVMTGAVPVSPGAGLPVIAANTATSGAPAARSTVTHDALAIIAVLEVTGLAPSLLGLLDNGEEDSILVIVTVVCIASASSIVTADVVTILWGGGPL